MRGHTRPSDGSPDQNVFDMPQGGAICLMVNLPEGARP